VTQNTVCNSVCVYSLVPKVHLQRPPVGTKPSPQAENSTFFWRMHRQKISFKIYQNMAFQVKKNHFWGGARPVADPSLGSEGTHTHVLPYSRQAFGICPFASPSSTEFQGDLRYCTQLHSIYPAHLAAAAADDDDDDDDDSKMTTKRELPKCRWQTTTRQPRPRCRPEDRHCRPSAHRVSTPWRSVG